MRPRRRDAARGSVSGPSQARPPRDTPGPPGSYPARPGGGVNRAFIETAARTLPASRVTKPMM